jgi:hypothetical protein
VTRTRVIALVVIVSTCALISVAYAFRARRAADVSGLTGTGVSADASALRTVLHQPHVFFRSTMLGDGYGRVSAVPLADPSGTRYLTGLVCDRVDFSGGTGVCLTGHPGVVASHSAIIFDETLAPLRTVPLLGVPSRVRVSPNGRLAGITVFVAGDSYTAAGFSTRTTLVDTQAGTVLANLENFAVMRDDRPFKEPDFNFWGVTFARDSNTFYATLGSGGVMYLIQGDTSGRRATVIGRGVECPSLSPDNRRIAFKRRGIVRGRLVWRLAVLDLSTGAQHVIDGEPRSVDDQVEWLDDLRILYSTPDPRQAGSMVVSVVPVDQGAASEFLRHGYSPAVVDR